MHVIRDGCDIFMLVNESMEEEFSGEVRLPVKGNGVRLNLLEDACYAVRAEGGRLAMKLGRGESTLLFFGDDTWKAFPPAPIFTRRKRLACAWTLTLKPAHGAADGASRKIDALYNVTGPQGDDRFSGWMTYETAFEASGDERALDLGLVGECAHVWLNGMDLGQRIDAPFVFDVKKAIREGKNELVVEVTNSLVHQQPDKFSRYVPIGPSGLLGPVSLMGTGPASGQPV